LFTNRRILQKKPNKTSSSMMVKSNSFPVHAPSSSNLGDSYPYDDMVVLMKEIKSNLSLSYEMLFQRVLIQANVEAYNVTTGGGQSNATWFQFGFTIFYNLTAAKNVTQLYASYSIEGNVVTKNLIIKWIGFYSQDRYFDYAFFPRTKLVSIFNTSVSSQWNISHFRKTPFENCTTAKFLSNKMNNTNFTQNYTYFCGKDKEVTASFVKVALSELALHSAEERFGSIANITFKVFIGSDKPIIDTIILSTQVTSKSPSSFRFLNPQLMKSSPIAQCVSANPELLEQIVFDFSLDFKQQSQSQATVKALKFLS